MGIAKYYHITRTGLNNVFAYVDDYLISAFFMFVLMFIFVRLWKIIYGTNHLIVGFSLAMMVWYLVVTETIMFSPIVSRDIGDEVQSGTIAYALNKPYNYILYKYADFLAHLIGKSTIVFLIGGLVVYFSIGGIHVSFWYLILFLIVFLMAVTIHFVISLGIGITAFWYEDTKGMEMVYHKFVFVFGGMLFPITIFPEYIYNIVKFLPFSTISFYPGKMFVDPSLGFFAEAIMFQGFWLIVFCIGLFFMYRKAIKEVSINGG